MLSLTVVLTEEYTAVSRVKAIHVYDFDSVYEPIAEPETMAPFHYRLAPGRRRLRKRRLVA